ncbi:hypothetical protein TSUD_100800 [Trifolium subterraneum]|uniref:CCHC-type domain-containing protein n=1 Tax=Trifolium subterraneum TaxID=3900 RepID=A0A2Z6NQQ1_TRISU|nr:hypothetical protein TSUD_100800 [Trifolium subterraneum]
MRNVSDLGYDEQDDEFDYFPKNLLGFWIIEEKGRDHLARAESIFLFGEEDILDIAGTNPYYIHPNESVTAALVAPPLDDKNYHAWSRSMLKVVIMKNKLCFLDGSCPMPDSLLYTDAASQAWSDLKARFSRADRVRVSTLQRDLYALHQESSFVSEYFTKLKGLWEELELSRPIPNCTCPIPCTCAAMRAAKKNREEDLVLLFLIGLNDHYSMVRSQILLMDPFPPLNSAFGLVIQHESLNSLDDSSSALINLAKKPYYGKGNSSNSNKTCTFCGKGGHIVDIFYKKHGYPPGFRFRDGTVVGKSQGNSSINNIAGENVESKAVVDSDDRVSFSHVEYKALMALLKSTKSEASSSSYHQVNSFSQHHASSSSNDRQGNVIYASCFSVVGSLDTWILDSGATDHVCPTLHLFTRYRKVKPIPVKFPNGSIVSTDIIDFYRHQSKHPVLDWVRFMEYISVSHGSLPKIHCSKTWKEVLMGWEPPVRVDKDDNKTEELKPESEWSKEEDELALGNSKALRTSKVKNSRLKMLTTKFEELRMKEDESVHDFHMTILDYANTFDALELDTIKLDDLVGSLQTYEMSANERSGSSGSKSKSIALVSNTDNEDHQGDLDTGESISDAMVLLGKQFNKVMRRMDRKTKGNVPNIRFDISKSANNFRRTKTDDKVGQSKGVQCHECESFGHIRTECGTFLKRHKKSMTATWSEEDESEEEAENEAARHVTALTGVVESDSDSIYDEVSYDELAGSFKSLCIRSEEVCEQLEAERRLVIQLKTERKCHLAKIGALNDEVSQLNSQLEHLKKQVVMMHHSTHVLDEILEKQVVGGPRPIGLDYETLNKKQMYDPDTKFMTAEGNHYSTVPRQMFQHPKRHQKTQMNRSRSWICHHCGKKGHIRPFCYKLYGYPNTLGSFLLNPLF